MKKILTFLLTLMMLLSIASCTSPSNSEPQEIVWTNLILHEQLPVPDSVLGKISVNLEHALSVTLYGFTNEQYTSYMSACIEKGFTIESEQTPSTYIAFNSQGYQVRLVHSNEDFYIHLDAPEKMSEFEWPTNGPGSRLPKTNSTLGDVSWDNSETFIVHVGETSIEEYNAYVKACEDIGFIIDYSKDDHYFSAYDADGYKLTLRYLGFSNIEISIKAPENTEQNNNNPPEVSTDSSMISEMRKEFKEAMDSYEKFFDEYVTFMKKYKDSNGADFTLLADYTKFLTQYTEMMKEFEEWESQELTTAETAYYIQVQGRISQKLLEVAQ